MHECRQRKYGSCSPVDGMGGRAQDSEKMNAVILLLLDVQFVANMPNTQWSASVRLRRK